MTGEIQVGVCYLTDTSKPMTPDAPEGKYRLELRGADGEVLGSHRFGLRFHAHGEPAPAERFALHVPFPAATATAAILLGEQALWAKAVSKRPPTVSFVSPVAGSVIQGDAVTTVRWTASDPDGDSLQLALDYSPDNGGTWHKLPQYLQGTSYEWQPLYLPASGSARLRIRASDGFNTATALSAPFTLVAPAPLAFIHAPEDGEVFLEGARIDLKGVSMTADGAPGTFHWELDGAAVAATEPETRVAVDIPGSHTIRLRVTDAAGKVSDPVDRSFEVIADYDRDGLPNDYEREHGFDPLYFEDAAGDADGDGLSNLGEYQQGTDPRNPDTDGDGWTDGAEVEEQTSPLHASDSPGLTPVLLVGAESLGFTVEQGGEAPEPTRFWITNGGGGNVAWTAAASERWVDLSPLAGTAPTEIALGVNPAGLAVGHYEAQVTVTARGAAESPQTIDLRLEVHERHDNPELPRFIRGDCNADGRVGGSVGDAVFILYYNFLGGAKPRCLAACDANSDGRVEGTVVDAVHLLSFSFLGGPPPGPPFPACGTHPAVDQASCKESAVCE